MKDVKIIGGRNIKSVRKKALAEGEKDLLAGADVDYFLVPKQRKKESDAQYAARLWRINKGFLTKEGEGSLPQSQKTYSRFKEELLARKKLAGDRFLAASRKKGEGEAEWAAKNAVRTLWESGEQRARANSVAGLKKTGAWQKFREWSRGTGPFSVSQLSYNSQEGRYEYAGKVAFKWEYRKSKKGKPGGMTFTITNMRTGQSMSQDDLAEEATQRALRRHGISA